MSRPLSPASADSNLPPKPTRVPPTPKLKARRELRPEDTEPHSNPARHRELRSLRADGTPLPPPGNARPPSGVWRDMQHFPQIGTGGSARSGWEGEAESSNLSSPSSNVHEMGILERPYGGPAIADNRESDDEGIDARAWQPPSVPSTTSPSPTDFQRVAEPAADVSHHPVDVAPSVMPPIEDEPPHVSPESGPTTTVTALRPQADSDRTFLGVWRDYLGHFGWG